MSFSVTACKPGPYFYATPHLSQLILLFSLKQGKHTVTGVTGEEGVIRRQLNLNKLKMDLQVFHISVISNNRLVFFMNIGVKGIVLVIATFFFHYETRISEIHDPS